MRDDDDRDDGVIVLDFEEEWIPVLATAGRAIALSPRHIAEILHTEAHARLAPCPDDDRYL